MLLTEDTLQTRHVLTYMIIVHGFEYNEGIVAHGSTVLCHHVKRQKNTNQKYKWEYENNDNKHLRHLKFLGLKKTTRFRN